MCFYRLQIMFPYKFNSLSVKAACDFLNDKMPEDTDIDEALAEFNLTGEQVFNEIQKALSKRKSNTTANEPFSLNDGDGNDANEKENQGTRGGRTARGGRSTTAGRAAASKSAEASKPATSSRGRGASRSTTNRTTAGPSARNGPNTTVHIFDSICSEEDLIFCLLPYILELILILFFKYC